MLPSTKPDHSHPATSGRRSAISAWSRRLILRILPAIILCWLLGDFIYSRIVLYRLHRWEATIHRDSDGVRTGNRAYTLEPEKRETGDEQTGNTALLLVHGINISPSVYHRIAPELQRGGLTVRAMRLPGFAMPMKQYAQYSVDDWVEGVAAEFRVLRDQHRTVIVVAHSLGGAIVLRALATRRIQPNGLVLLAPAIEVSNARSPVLPTRFWHEFAKRTLLFTRIVESPFTYDLNDPSALADLPQQPFTPRRVVDQVFQLVDANRGAAENLDTPMLMILSATDRIVDTPAAERFFAQWRGADKKLIVLKDSAHMLPLDYQWPDVARAIAEFAKRISDTRQTDRAP